MFRVSQPAPVLLTFALILWLCIPAVPALAADPGRFVSIHSDHWIPNFTASEVAGAPLINSAKDGNWSDPATWGGRLPTRNESVIVRHNVIFDTQAEVFDLGVYPGGAVRFRPDVNTFLKVGTIEVMEGAILEIGTQTTPVQANVTAEIVFANRPLNTTVDPAQFGIGLLAFGKMTMHGTPKAATFVRLGREPLAGDVSLSLEQPVTGWKAGDRLILPDTRMLKDNEAYGYYVPQWEELVVSGVSSDGRTVALSAPLRFNHRGARDADGALKFLPHVGNLSRNVVLRSENPGGIRGHVLFTDRAEVDVRYALFRDLGRTTISRTDNTTIDANGNATHIGTNQIGRYAVHAHHLLGPGGSSGSEYQFVLHGNAVDNGSATSLFKWGMVVHGSHYGLVSQNVVYNTGGSGIAFEDGSESFNLLAKNFVVRVSGQGGRADGDPLLLGALGTGYWFRGPNNYVRDNVVANVSPNTNTYGYEIFAQYLGTIRVPNFRGADPMIDSQYTSREAYTVPILEFSGNEAYGALESGMVLWWVGTNWLTPRPAGTSVVKDFRVWHAYRYGFFNYEISNVLVDGMVARGDAANPGISIGAQLQDYLTNRVVFRNADFQGMNIGFMAPVNVASGNPEFIIENSYLRNRVNVVVTHLWSCCFVDQNVRRVRVNNTRFEPMGNNPLVTIQMYWLSDAELSFRVADLIEVNQVFVQDYNQRPGDNFQVFFLQQNPQTVVPQQDFVDPGFHTGSPEANLTNEQNWAKYKIALAGAVAPCLDTKTRPEIIGYVCPVPGGIPPITVTEESPTPVSTTTSTQTNPTPSTTVIPTGLSPVNGTILPATTTTVTLAWAPIPGATRYAIRMDYPGSTLRDPRNNCSAHYLCTEVTSPTISVPVQPGITYNWWFSPLLPTGWSDAAGAGFSVQATSGGTTAGTTTTGSSTTTTSGGTTTTSSGSTTTGGTTGGTSTTSSGSTTTGGTTTGGATSGGSTSNPSALPAPTGVRVI